MIMPLPEFDGVMARLVPPGGPGAAVAIERGGEVIHSAGYGLANIEWSIAITPTTVFRIGSITKQFTAAAIMRLAEGGKLSIDDPIEAYLPDYPVAGRRITLRHLLTHTSGIKNYTALTNFDFGGRGLRPAALIGVFKDLPPDFEPGERANYSNSGYALLGAVIEAVSGQAYQDHLAEQFFAPLGLGQTYYLHDRPIVPQRASGYSQGAETRNAAPMAMNNAYAAGALGSTVLDLLRWQSALRGGRVVSPESYAAMTTAARLNDGSATLFGLGLRSLNYRGRRVVEHAGGINGFLAELAYWPEADLTIAVLSNSEAFPVEQALYSLARRALGLADTLREAWPQPSVDLLACAGTYRFQKWPVAFAADEHGLRADFPRWGSRFRPAGPGLFWPEQDPEALLRFEDLDQGRYQKVTWEGYFDPIVGVRVGEG
jgi:CubicO group peptidase (beta-lactamase class C family)